MALSSFSLNVNEIYSTFTNTDKENSSFLRTINTIGAACVIANFYNKKISLSLIFLETCLSFQPVVIQGFLTYKYFTLLAPIIQNPLFKKLAFTNEKKRDVFYNSLEKIKIKDFEFRPSCSENRIKPDT